MRRERHDVRAKKPRRQRRGGQRQRCAYSSGGGSKLHVLTSTRAHICITSSHNIAWSSHFRRVLLAQARIAFRARLGAVNHLRCPVPVPVSVPCALQHTSHVDMVVQPRHAVVVRGLHRKHTPERNAVALHIPATCRGLNLWLNPAPAPFTHCPTHQCPEQVGAGDQADALAGVVHNRHAVDLEVYRDGRAGQGRTVVCSQQALAPLPLLLQLPSKCSLAYLMCSLC